MTKKIIPASDDLKAWALLSMKIFVAGVIGFVGYELGYIITQFFINVF